MRFSEFITRKRTLILDGATGTELQRRGIDTGLPLWSTRALIHAPHVVREIHREYLEAGADIITTNTFRTNIRTLQRAGIGDRWEEINLTAVQLAFEARERYPIERPVFIAASIAPVEECYSPHLVPSEMELEEDHGRQAELLAGAGVDFLLVETMNTVREALAAARSAAVTGIPWMVSFVCDNRGDLLSGESADEAVSAVESYAPEMILVNCISAAHIHRALANFRRATRLPIGLYANVGTPSIATGWEFSSDVTVDSFADSVCPWLQEGARLIGGCCGTTPGHIARIRKELKATAGRNANDE